MPHLFLRRIRVQLPHIVSTLLRDDDTRQIAGKGAHFPPSKLFQLLHLPRAGHRESNTHDWCNQHKKGAMPGVSGVGRFRRAPCSVDQPTRPDRQTDRQADRSSRCCAERASRGTYRRVELRLEPSMLFVQSRLSCLHHAHRHQPPPQLTHM
jgi:hypothetical protein